MEKIAKTTATASLVDNKRSVKLLPKAVVLKALGGYEADQLANAENVTKSLAEFCIRCGFVIVPNADGTLHFVAQEDLAELVKQLEQTTG